MVAAVPEGVKAEVVPLIAPYEMIESELIDTEETILNTVLDITRESGFNNVNARSIASKLQCYTRPIFTCYKNMSELKVEFLDFAFDFYTKYVTDYSNSTNVCSYLILPLSYVEFAKQETNLFKLLFIDDMELNMAEAKDFYNEIDNERKARIFSEEIGIEFEYAKTIFLDLFLYTHGIAVLTAAGKISIDNSSIEQMISNMLSALIRQAKPERTF